MGIKSQRKGRAAGLEQARRDAERFGDGLPVVFHRRDREAWAVFSAFPGPGILLGSKELR